MIFFIALFFFFAGGVLGPASIDICKSVLASSPMGNAKWLTVGLSPELAWSTSDIEAGKF